MCTLPEYTLGRFALASAAGMEQNKAGKMGWEKKIATQACMANSG